jgi:hypothetical protein
MEVESHLQHDMIPHDTVSATLDAWPPGAGIVVWDWIPLLLHETSTSEYFSLHIVELSESESKVHLEQVNLPTRVKAQVVSFLQFGRSSPLGLRGCRERRCLLRELMQPLSFHRTRIPAISGRGWR